MFAFLYGRSAKIHARLLMLAATTLALTLAGIAGAQTPGAWSQTGSMSIPRGNPAAAQLLSGKVLVTGGSDGTTIRGTAELYDPSTGTFSSTGSMILARAEHTATLLQNGQVLITGGVDNNNLTRGTAEIYDPSSGTFSSTGSMITARREHTATLLADGRVLITGGIDNNGDRLYTAEIYDPATGTFSATGDMHDARDLHTATLLTNGKVLVAGGEPGLATAELYDPSTGAFTLTGSMATARFWHTATLLPDGRVLMAGGLSPAQDYPVNSAEIYDPASASFSTTGNMTVPHAIHTATLLANGEVLIAAGRTFDPNHGPGQTNLAELYDPASGAFTATGSLIFPRIQQVASPLSNGQVLVAGGSSNAQATQTAELYTPPTMPAAKIMSPANGALVAGTVNVFTAVSSQVAWINIYVDGQYLASSPPYNFAWDSTKVSNGSHTISIKAFNSGGQIGSDSISVDVENGAVSSAVTITSPSNGSSVSGTVSIVTQLGSSVSWEDVYIDGKYFASSPPETFSWDSTTVANGSHTISATAFNSSDQQIGSDSVTVNVSN